MGTRAPRGLGRGHRQAPGVAVRTSPLEALAQDEVRALAGVRGRRFHGSAGRARGARRAAGGLLRRGRPRVRRKDRNRVRHEAADRPAAAARRDRDRQDALHEGHRPAPPARALGAAGTRRPGRLHRVDGERQAAASTADRRAPRQERARRGPGAAVITHPDKLLFPADGITKGELAAYYEAIAPVMLPHLRGRPLTLERYPGGIGSKGFWQKDVSKGFPSWLERVEVPKKDGVVHHPVITDARSLMWVTNQNTITQHVWTSRLPELSHPDICVFDLDPSNDDRDSVRGAAVGLRDLLDKLSLPSWVKTTGSKGFHIVVPLDGSNDMGQVGRFADEVGEFFVRVAPDALTREFNKVDRRGRIYVDTGRNGYSATFAAPYTVRAKPGAPVSAPCTWEEIERGKVDPGTFTVRNMPERIKKVGDLWADMKRRSKSLKASIEKLRRLRDRA